MVTGVDPRAQAFSGRIFLGLRCFSRDLIHYPHHSILEYPTHSNPEFPFVNSPCYNFIKPRNKEAAYSRERGFFG